MTSVLPEEEESNVTRLKQKSQTHVANQMGKSIADESRSFLNFSRENLSISNSDLEQGFNTRSLSSSSRGILRCCCNRQTLLSCAALLLALSCAALELWKLRRVLANSRDIELLKRDVESLKHRFLEKDLLDELKAFEEQLYGEGASEEDNEDDPSSNALSSDYDSSYDDSSSSSSSSGDYQSVTTTTTTTATSNTNPGSKLPSTSPPATTKSSSTTSSSTTPCTSKDLNDVLAVLRRAEAERGQAFEHSVARERKRLLEEEREREHRRLVEEYRIRDDDGDADGGGDDEEERNKRRAKRDARLFYTRLKLTSGQRTIG